MAFELGLPYFRWNIQSTTKAQDGQYVYDALSRLYDVELVKGGMEAKRDPSSAKRYCDDGELGKAFRHRGSRSVLLIDEVDKAELDFPNDLLTLLLFISLHLFLHILARSVGPLTPKFGGTEPFLRFIWIGWRG